MEKFIKSSGVKFFAAALLIHHESPRAHLPGRFLTIQGSAWNQ